MATFDASQAFRYSTDNILAYPSVIGVSQYRVNLITVINDSIGYADPRNTRIATSRRLTVSDGYRNYAGDDGYLNPLVRDLTGKTIILSGGSMVDMSIMLGPLVFPYNLNNQIGGLDPNIFFPVSSATNTQIYIQLQGISLNKNNGNFFAVKEVVLDKMSNIYYKLHLVGISVVIPNLVEI